MQFVVAVEDFQVAVIHANRAGGLDDELYKHLFTVVEVARSKIDVLGSDGVRVWAYRCTMALRALSVGQLALREHYRSKLHDARANLVSYVRSDLSQTATRSTSVAAEDNGEAHDRWLQGGASIGATAERIRDLARLSDLGLLPSDHGGAAGPGSSGAAP